jgi:hypothetical protein
MGLSIILGTGLWGTGSNAPPIFMGWMFTLIGTFAVLTGWTYSALNWYAARCIGRRQRKLFLLVLAGINCANIPLGLVLGIFTFSVLLGSSVAPLFERSIASSTTNTQTIQAIAPPLQSLGDEAIWLELEKKAKQDAAEKARITINQETEQSINLSKAKEQEENEKS